MKAPSRFTGRLLAGLGSSVLAVALQAAPLLDRLQRPASPADTTEPMLLTDIQRLDEQLVMVGESGRILLRSSDGHTQQAAVPVDLLLTAVHFVDTRNGWAVGHDGVVLHSSDGGQHWVRQLDGNTINALMLASAQATVARLQAASDEAPSDSTLATALDNALFELDDAKAGAAAGPSRPLLGVWFRSPQEGWVVGAYGMILHTTDGGAHWQYLAGLDNTDRLHLNSLVGLADGTLLVAGEGGRLYRQVAGQWQPAQQLTQASLYRLQVLRDGRLLAMGFGGALFSSSDQGQHWQAIALPVKASLFGATQLADGGVLLSGQGGLLLYSEDLQHFGQWRGVSKTPWMGVASAPGGQLTLVGGSGVQQLPLAELKESLQ